MPCGLLTQLPVPMRCARNTMQAVDSRLLNKTGRPLTHGETEGLKLVSRKEHEIAFDRLKAIFPTKAGNHPKSILYGLAQTA